MASDEEDDDLEALRQAALATLKKRPVAVELQDAQPIPQITGSGHCLTGSASQWAEDFPANTLLQGPFGNNQPTSAFQDGVWSQQFHPSKFHPTSPKRFGQNNWRVGRGLYLKHTAQGRGVNLRRGQPFHPKGAAFPHVPRLPFVQTPPVPNRGSNLIVINTVPENEEGAQQECAEVSGAEGLSGPGRVGPRAGTSVTGGRSGSTVAPLETSSKPLLIRPQDKYCSTTDKAPNEQESIPSHRKKKDKFSRFDSSGSDSDDESESEDEQSGKDQDVSSQSCFPSVGDSILEESKDMGSSVEQCLQNITDTAEPDLSITVASEALLDDVSGVHVSHDGGRSCDSETDEQEEEKLLLSPVTESARSMEPDQSGAARLKGADSADEGKSLLPGARSDQDAVEELSSPASKDEEAKSNHDGSTSIDGESSSASDEEEGSSDTDSSASDSESAASASESGSEVSEEDSDGDEGDDSASEEQASEASSSSDSLNEAKKQKTVQKLPDLDTKVASSQSSIHTSERKKGSESNMTSAERAKLEARKRKFASGEEIQVSPNKTISLKGIVSKSKRLKTVVESVQTRAVKAVKAATQAASGKTSEGLSQKPVADVHRKHSKRKIIVDERDKKLVGVNPQGSARVVQDTDEDEDEEDNKERSWKREANSSVGWRKPSQSFTRTVPGESFGRSHSFPGKARQEFGRNGSHWRGYDGRNRPSGIQTYHHSSPPGVHYSSSDEAEDESGRKLISVVVSRSATSQQSQNTATRLPVPSRGRPSKGPRRPLVPQKREAPSSVSVVSTGHAGDGRAVLHSKQLPDSDSFACEQSLTTDIVSSEDTPLVKRSCVKADRKPVHQRLGWKDIEGRSSRSTVHSHKRNEADSDSDYGSNRGELDQRIQNIKKQNAAILRRQEEVQQDRELYG